MHEPPDTSPIKRERSWVWVGVQIAFGFFVVFPLIVGVLLGMLVALRWALGL